MKRMHIHISVDNLESNIKFYSTLFGCEPTIQHKDYAKWRLDDPMVNFAISDKGRENGLNHLGFELDSDDELEAISKRIDENNLDKLEEKGASCCYAQSDKYWTLDPQGIPWENFHTLGDIPVYGENSSKDAENAMQCCSGEDSDIEKAQSKCC